MGEHHWKFLLHVMNAIYKKVTKCPWTDCNNNGDKITKKKFARHCSLVLEVKPDWWQGTTREVKKVR
jgi:hypothetical protein